MIVADQRERASERVPTGAEQRRPAPAAAPPHPAVPHAPRRSPHDPLAGVLARAVLQRVKVSPRALIDNSVALSQDDLRRNDAGDLIHPTTTLRTRGDAEFQGFLYASEYNRAREDLTALTGIFRPGRFGPEFRLDMKERQGGGLAGLGSFAVAYRSPGWPESVGAAQVMHECINNLLDHRDDRLRRDNEDRRWKALETASRERQQARAATQSS